MQAAGFPNQCSRPEEFAGPEATILYGECQFYEDNVRQLGVETGGVVGGVWVLGCVGAQGLGGCLARGVWRGGALALLVTGALGYGEKRAPRPGPSSDHLPAAPPISS